jgi:hypothetical protein
MTARIRHPQRRGKFFNDNESLYFGTDQDVSLTFDGTNLNATGNWTFPGTSTFSGASTFSQLAKFTNVPTSSLDGSILLSSTIPMIGFEQTDASANNGVWDILGYQEAMIFRSANDSGAGNVEWLRVERTGTTIDSVTFFGEVSLKEGASNNAAVEYVDTDNTILGNVGFARGTNEYFVGTAQNDLAIESIFGEIVFATNNTERMALTNAGALVAGTVDADFDAITATSYGGITEANLVDKSANETITGVWDVTGDLKANSNYVLEGYATQRNVLRCLCVRVDPGSTPGTNYNITFDSVRSWNVATPTNATNMTASTTNGSFTSNANSRILTFDDYSNVIAVISSDMLYSDANNSTQDLTVDAYPSSSQLDWSLVATPGSVTQNHATMTSNSGDFIIIRFIFVTNA